MESECPKHSGAKEMAIPLPCSCRVMFGARHRVTGEWEPRQPQQYARSCLRWGKRWTNDQA